MSMLLEKRQEIQSKIDTLIEKRRIEIDELVKAYRESLEAEPENQEILELRKVIEALDAVIAYEEPKQEIIEEPNQEEVIQEEEIPVEEPIQEETVQEEVIQEPIEEKVEEIKEVEISEEAIIEELPTEEDLNLESNEIAEKTEVENSEIIVEKQPEVVISSIPTGEVISNEADVRPGLTEIKIPERR